MKIFTIISQTLILTAALALIGCSTAPPETAAKTADAGAAAASGAPVAIKRYPVHGKVLTVDAAARTARIDAGAIGDWMGPMTMNYTIKDDAGLATLTAGSTFDGTVFVQGDDFWLGEIKASK